MELLSFFDVEHRFSKDATQKWMQVWWTQCFYISAVYVGLIHWGQWMMKDRKRFTLRKALFLWNLALAVFSAIGFYRMGGQFISEFRRHGWQKTICSLDWLDGQTGLWCGLFGFSKYPELVDTLFIVLRKQKLIFLHWYHHITVFCYCWYSYNVPHGQGQLFISMNFFVHALMYSYYAIRAQGLVRIPFFVSVGVTSLQLLQMVFGFALYVDAYLMLRNGVPCNVNYLNVFFGLGIYFSYAVLFAHFFYVNYVKKKI